MILFYALLVNLAIGSFLMLYQWTRHQEVKDDIEALQAIPSLPRSIVIMQGFLLNPWHLLFDFLLHLTMPPQEGDDHDQDPWDS